MRLHSPVIEELISRDATCPFLLVKLGPNKDGITFRYTTFTEGLMYNGEWYSADNGLSYVDPPKLSELLDREAYKISFSDPSYELRSFLEGGSFTSQFTGANVEVIGGFVNITESSEFDTAPGRPYKDFMILYKGYLDVANYSINSNEEIILEFECASPMGVLDLTRTILNSKNYLNQKYPTDTSYDQVLESGAKLELQWGKKP